jgi:hypothetical protein
MSDIIKELNIQAPHELRRRHFPSYEYKKRKVDFRRLLYGKKGPHGGLHDLMIAFSLSLATVGTGIWLCRSNIISLPSAIDVSSQSPGVAGTVTTVPVLPPQEAVSCATASTLVTAESAISPPSSPSTSSAGAFNTLTFPLPYSISNVVDTQFLTDILIKPRYYPKFKIFLILICMPIMFQVKDHPDDLFPEPIVNVYKARSTYLTGEDNKVS